MVQTLLSATHRRPDDRPNGYLLAMAFGRDATHTHGCSPRCARVKRAGWIGASAARGRREGARGPAADVRGVL